MPVKEIFRPPILKTTVLGMLVDRFSAKVVCSTPAAFSPPTIGMVVVFGITHAWFYGAQGTLYASLFPTRVRYTGLSTVYQLSGVYASGLTPLILTALIAATDGSPWLACCYLVGTAVNSVVATCLLKPAPLSEL